MGTKCDWRQQVLCRVRFFIKINLNQCDAWEYVSRDFSIQVNIYSQIDLLKQQGMNETFTTIFCQTEKTVAQCSVY